MEIQPGLMSMRNDAAIKVADEHTESVREGDQSEYPYGLRIHLDKKTLAKLQIEEAPEIGKRMKLNARVSVIGSHRESMAGQENMAVDLQITDMTLSKEDSERFPEEVIYTD